MMEDQGLFEQHVLKLNLSEGKAKKSSDRRNTQLCEGGMAAKEIHLKKKNQTTKKPGFLRYVCKCHY